MNYQALQENIARKNEHAFVLTALQFLYNVCMCTCKNVYISCKNVAKSANNFSLLATLLSTHFIVYRTCTLYSIMHTLSVILAIVTNSTPVLK